MFTIYAEKADVAGKIVEYAADRIVSYPTRGQDDFYHVYINGEEGFVTWGYGHLCRLSREYEYNPEYRNWHKMPLPFFPDDNHISLNVESKYPVQHQYEVVKRLFDQSDYIINATDYDREGELIFYYLYRYMGCTTPVKRLKLDRQTPEGFRSALKHLEDPSTFEDMLLAARSRSLADSIVGWNVTVASTLKCGGELCSAGRIQTTVLNMIVEREKEIENFKPTDYFTVGGVFTKADGSQYKGSYKQKKFEKQADAVAIVNDCRGKDGTVTDVKKTERKREVPYLYNLDTLQKAAADKFHFSLERTLNTAQSLYSKGLLTYPRTGSQFLNEGMVPMMEHVHEILRSNGYAEYFGSVAGSGYMEKQKKRFFDDSKVDAHYAIIPTEIPAKDLTGDEQKIYDLVAKSVIRMIYPPAILEQTDAVTTVGEHEFHTKGTAIKEANWMVVDTSKKEELIPVLSVGEVVDAAVSCTAKKTEPPKYYTESTLLTAMLSAGKKIEDEELREFLVSTDRVALGTQATRAAIVQTLYERRYADKEKGETIRPTRRGIDFIDMLPCPDLKSAEMTAKWERRIADVGQGKEDMDHFIEDIKSQTTKWCEQIMALQTVPRSLCGQPDVTLLCPACGKPLRKFSWGWGCTGREDGCSFSLGTICGKKLTDKQVEDLVKKGIVGPIKGMKSKSGKTFDGWLRLDKEPDGAGHYNCKLAFANDPSADALKCPVCGKSLRKHDWGYGCSGYQDGCKFAIGKIGGKVLTDKQVRELLTNGEVALTGLTSKKTGRTFDATLEIHKEIDESGNVISCETRFKEPSNQEMSLSCPVCGRPLRKMSWGYGCSGYQEGCKFAVGKIGGKVLTEEELTELITKGEVSLTGLLSKAKKRYDATICLNMQYDDNQKPISCELKFKERQDEATSLMCPTCGSNLMKTAWGFRCSRHDEGCKFSIGEVCGHKFTEEEVRVLLRDEKIGPIQGLKSKAGKKFTAYIILEEDGEGGYKLGFAFENQNAGPSLKNQKKDIYVKCPECGGHMIRGEYGWECENKCGMMVPYIKNGRVMEESLAEALLQQGSTDYLTGFVSQKTGNAFVAALRRNGKKIELVFPDWNKGASGGSGKSKRSKK